MKSFAGFRPGPERQVALPESFFTELLPLVDDLAELKVTLVCWRILAQTDAAQGVSLDDLQNDAATAGLDRAALQDGLERAAARGSLLRAPAGRGQERYFANTEAGRAAASAARLVQRPGGAEAVPRAERPNIFALYEQAIGMLSPILADELRDAEETYPAEWIEEAFREAARQNARSWAYVRKILERRAQRGKRAPRDGSASAEWRRAIRGEP